MPFKSIINKARSMMSLRAANPTFADKEHAERYTHKQFIAKGGNGEVNLCQDNKIGKLVAIKRVRVLSSEADVVPLEVTILEKVTNHDNIVHFYHMMNDAKKAHHKHLVFEYCDRGDLHTYVTTHPNDVPEMFMWHALKQLAAGLHQIHRQGIVHGDLKPANVLLSSPPDANSFPILKIADFGASRIDPRPDIPRAHRGTWGYSGPESPTHYGTEQDIWGVGCIMHFLAHKRNVHVKQNAPKREDANAWFEAQGLCVPDDTPCPEDYKRWCLWQDQNPMRPLRVDKPSKHVTVVRSKLLNYHIMRCLEMRHRERITTSKLHRALPILEPFVRQVLEAGMDSVLECFEDGRDEHWRVVEAVSDTDVIKSVFDATIERAAAWDRDDMLAWAEELPELMKEEDRVSACRRMTEIKINMPI